MTSPSNGHRRLLRFTTTVSGSEEVFNRWKYWITGITAVTALAIMTAVVTVKITSKIREEDAACGTNYSTSRSESLSERAKYVLNEIASNINASVDPCEDFYEYACGSFQKRYPLPSGKTEVNYHTIYSDQVYSTIVHRLQGNELKSKETIEPLRYLKNIWDICINDDSDTSAQVHIFRNYAEFSKGSWQNKFSRLTSWGYNLLFTVKFIHALDRKVKVAISPQEFELENLYASRDQLTRYLSDLFNLIEPGNENSVHSLSDLLDFGHRLAGIRTASNKFSENPLTSTMTLGELNGYTRLNWPQKLKEMFEFEKINSVGISYKIPINESTSVEIEDRTYVKKFFLGMEQVEGSFLLEYMKARVLHQACLYLGKDCRDLQFKLYQEVPELPKFENRSRFVQKMCFDFLLKNRNYEDLMFRIFEPNEVFHARKLYFSLITNLVGQLERTINDTSLMDTETEAKARDSLRTVLDRITIQAPGYIYADDKLKAKYLDAPFMRQSMAQYTIYHFMAFLHEDMRSMSANEIKFKLYPNWPISLFSTRPYFSPELRHLFVPQFFIEGPFASTDLPSPIQFGFFGFLLAHELTHAFDALTDFYGQLHGQEQFWSDWTRSNFNATMQCLVGVRETGKVDIELQGDPTQEEIKSTFDRSENLADMIGLKVAYETFKDTAEHLDTSDFPDILKDMDKDQLFFLAFANVYCTNRPESSKVAPSKSTVNLLLSHTKKFAQAFKCKLGSKMNPHKRCPFR